MEVHSDRCKVRATTKESRLSELHLVKNRKGGETMPIKWSAIKVSEDMDDIERQINLAESFLAEARVKAEVARKIDDLPQYVDQRLIRLTYDIQRIDNVKSSIEAVRQSIPDGAIEAEQKHIKNGSQQSLI